MCTLDGSRSAARWYASSASAVWLLQDSYCAIVSEEPSVQGRSTTYQCAEVVPDF